MKTTKKLLDASQEFANDLDSARWTMLRLSQIQGKMSQCMDDALAEFQDLMAPETPEDLPTAPNGHSGYNQDLPNIIEQMRQSGALRDEPRRHIASLPKRGMNGES